MRKAAVVLLILLLAASAGCGGAAPPCQKYSYEFFGTFDTVVDIVGYAKSQAEFDGWAKKAEARFRTLDEQYDMYNSYPGINNIKTVNDNAGVAPVKVSPEVLSLVKFCLDWHARSPGVVNIALGPVLTIWHDFREKGLADPAGAALPPMEALTAASQRTDINKVLVDEKNGTVFLRDEGMSLDVGAEAKGYATELVAEELEAAGWQSFIINSGGNVRAVGKPLDGARSKWGVGIADPDDPGGDEAAGSLLDTAFVSDLSVVTSGDYQRYYTVGGKRYSHIIDPDTLMPAARFRAVTVVTKDSGEADYLSTTLFILPWDKGLEYLKGLGNAEALWVFPDGTVKATDGMRAMLKKMGGATAQ